MIDRGDRRLSTPTTATTIVTGLFRDREQAERAYRVLRERGYSDADVNVMMSDGTRQRIADDAHSSSTHVRTSGGLPLVTETGSKAAKGAGAGGATGGLLGALVGAGIPVERVKHYEAGLKRGGILLGVHARSEGDAEFLEEAWRSGGAEHVYRSTRRVGATARPKVCTPGTMKRHITKERAPFGRSLTPSAQ